MSAIWAAFGQISIPTNVDKILQINQQAEGETITARTFPAASFSPEVIYATPFLFSQPLSTFSIYPPFFNQRLKNISAFKWIFDDPQLSAQREQNSVCQEQENMFSDIKKPPVRNSKEADAVVALRPHFPSGIPPCSAAGWRGVSPLKCYIYTTLFWLKNQFNMHV